MFGISCIGAHSMKKKLRTRIIATIIDSEKFQDWLRVHIHIELTEQECFRELDNLFLCSLDISIQH